MLSVTMGKTYWLALRTWLRRHRLRLLGVATLAIILLLALTVGCWAWISPYGQYVLAASPAGADAAVTAKHIRVGIVMGAGVTKQGKPFRELQARLDVAAQALQADAVDKLLLTGDNSRKTYDEPGAMQRYLTEVKHVNPAQLQVDDAGRDTYASCERAVRIFGVHQAVIFSAGTHLPRAIFLCRQFGIEAYGVSSGVEANNAHRREVMARVKAVLNAYHLLPDPVILGDPISL
jgi:vancomycin permeability regulator SanA